MRVADAGPLRVSRALVPDMDVVHVHWLEYLLGSNDREPQKPVRMLARGVRLLAALTALRARGVRVVWTVHNLTPHDALHPRLDLALAWACARVSHRLIAHSHYAAQRVGQAYGVSKTTVAYHGNFIGHYPPANTTRGETRERLGIPADAHVFLAFGQVRAYKRLPELVHAVRALPRNNVRLIVAGKPTPLEAGAALEAAAAGDPRIIVCPQHIADEDVAALHDAADVAVLPYREVFSSGVLLLALSLGLPVITPETSTATELAASPAVQPYRPGRLQEGLERSITYPRADTRAAALAAATEYPWDRTAAAVIEAYGVPG
jgi:beta-1,4-mannosyltransferase